MNLRLTIDDLLLGKKTGSPVVSQGGKLLGDDVSIYYCCGYTKSAA